MQVTAGSFTGAFGRSALYWAVRLLDEGCVHLIASDAHDVERRPPDLASGRESVAKRVGAQEAQNLVFTRPMGILKDLQPSSLPGPFTGAQTDGESVEMPEPSRGRGQPNNIGSHAAHGVRGFSDRLRRFFR